jgi:hypothetical protein
MGEKVDRPSRSANKTPSPFFLSPFVRALGIGWKCKVGALSLQVSLRAMLAITAANKWYIEANERRQCLPS